MFIISLFLISIHVVPGDTVIARVVKVRDGDTIEILLATGKIIPVRLHGVDSPDKCQPEYEEAKRFTKDLLMSNNVMFVQTGSDQYGRAVGEIFFDDINTSSIKYDLWFNAVIVSTGYAWHWLKYSDSAELASFQEKAKQKKIGVWKGSNPMAPWEFRKTTAYKNCKLAY